MKLYNLITCRHSERKYQKKQIPQDDIQKIIDSGLSAPSGMNTQPWHFTVIQNKDKINELVKACKNNFLESDVQWRKNWASLNNFNPFYDPNFLIVVSNKTAVANSNEDCCFAIQNMVLMAEELGLSSCIIRDIGWAINKNNQAKYGIPEDYDCFLSISFGYAESKNKNKKSFDYSKVNYIK